MITEGLGVTAVGMASVFLFLLLLVVSMKALAAAFEYLGVEDGAEASVSTGGDEEEALVAAIPAVTLKNG